MRRSGHITCNGANIVACALLTLKTIAHGAGANETEALTQDATAGHVLLGLQFAKVQRGGKDQYVGHVDQTL